MNKSRNKIAVILFSTVFILGIPISSYAGQITDHNTGENTALIAQPAEDIPLDKKAVGESLPSNGTGAAKGCATGAAVGTILFPGVGTIAGCAIVAIVGWFW